jgi:hypothetical protein
MTEPDLDTDKLDNAALAILSLTLHDGNRVWKGISTGRSPTGCTRKGLSTIPSGRRSRWP